MLKKLFLAALAGLAVSPACLAKTPCAQSTAFQIRDRADLVKGPKADGRLGDFKLCNNKISAVIETARNSNGYHPYGGMIVDLVHTDGSDEDLYHKSFPIVTSGGNMLGLRTMKATKVWAESGQGEAKIVAEAEDGSFPVIESFINRPIPSHGFTFRIEYILKDNSTELLTRIYPSHTKSRSWLVGIGMGFFAGDGLFLVGPKFGYNTGQMVRKKTDYLAATAERSSFAWVSPKKPFNAYFPYNTSIFGGYSEVNTPPGAGQTKAWFDFFTLVGRGDMESLRQRAEEIRFDKKPEAGVALTATVTRAKGSMGDCGRVPVYVMQKEGDADQFFTMGRLDETCKAVFNLPKNTYRIVAAERGVGAWGDQTVTLDGPKTITMERPPTAMLTVTVTEKGKKGPQPAIFTMKPQFDLPDVPPAVGLSVRQNNHAHIMPQGVKQRPVWVRAGNYALWAQKGFEYNTYSGSVSLAPGTKIEKKIELVRQVDRPGWFTADYHVHFYPSMDSDHSMEDALLAALANGLDIAVATDHNVVTDPMPDILKLGIQNDLKSVVGLEMTTYSTGHFNLFPLKYNQDALNHGFDVPDWHKLLVPELFDRMRKLHGDDIVVQINHARGGKGGYFSASGYDYKTGVARDTALMPENLRFDMMEILNNPIRSRMAELLQDWESFMRKGKRIVMSGVSDTHDYTSLDMALCRSYVFTGHKTLKEVTNDAFKKATKAGKVIVDCGQFLNIEAMEGGKVVGRLGDTVKAPGKKTEIKIQVKAADWIGAEKITLMVNGLEPVKTIEIPQKPGPVNFTTTVPLTLEKDAYVWAMVVSSKPLAPFYGFGEPTSIANPIFFDVNGDGEWTP